MALNPTRLAASAAAAVMLLAGASPAVTSALAQDNEAEEVRPAAEPAEPGDHTIVFERRHEEHEEQFATALAAELDLPVDQVRAAVRKVREEMRAEREAQRKAAFRAHLDASVADGELTREQADAILAAAEAGVLPMLMAAPVHAEEAGGPGEHREVHRRRGPGGPGGRGGAGARAGAEASA